MSITQKWKRAWRYIRKGIPVENKIIQQTTANIVSLSVNELLKGRVAIVTGGTSGIGYSIAEAFLNSGARVVITGRSEERLQSAVCQLKEATHVSEDKIYGVVLDNSKPETFMDKFIEIRKLLGGNTCIDILVNNAGVLGGHIINTTEEQFDTVLDTNLKGVFFLSRLLAKHMKNNGIKGNILNIASSSSLRPAVSAYTLSKWGLRGLTLGLAKALIPFGIVVNGVAPGPTATPMLIKDNSGNIDLPSSPAGRYALPEEIANMAVVLVSDMGRMVIGDIVYMTGGTAVVTYEDMKYPFY